MLNWEFVTVLVNQLVNIFTVFLLTKLMAENFNFIEIAAYSIITVVQNLNIQLLGGPLSAYIGRFYRVRQQISDYINIKIFLIIVQICSILISVRLLLSYINPEIVGDTISIVYLVICFYIILFILQLCLIAILECQRLRVKSLFGQLCDSTLKITALFILLYIGKFSLMNVIIVGCISLLISNLLLSGFVILSYQRESDFPTEHSNPTMENYPRALLVNFIRPIILWGFVGWAYQSTNRISLNEFSTSKELAVYYVYFQLFFIPGTLLFSIISKYCLPIFREVNDNSGYNAYRNIEKKMISRLSVATIFGVLLSMLVLFYFDEFLIDLVTSEAYVGSFYVYIIFIYSGSLWGLLHFLVHFSISLSTMGHFESIQ